MTLFVLVLENMIIVNLKVRRAKKQKAAIKPPLMMKNNAKSESGFLKSIFKFFTSRGK